MENLILSRPSVLLSSSYLLSGLFLALLSFLYSQLPLLRENKDYAKHVIELAIATQDEELSRLVEKLRQVFDLSMDQDESLTDTTQHVQDDLIVVEPTQEDIHRAQVAHRYIGALR